MAPGRPATQRDGEAEPGERQRQALADDAGAGHLHIEGSHRGDCRERSETIAGPSDLPLPLPRGERHSNDDTAVSLQSIHVYPIKSCAGTTPAEALLVETGFDLDRAWMVVDSGGEFVTQRELPRMALVQTDAEERAR